MLLSHAQQLQALHTPARPALHPRLPPRSLVVRRAQEDQQQQSSSNPRVTSGRTYTEGGAPVQPSTTQAGQQQQPQPGQPLYVDDAAPVSEPGVLGVCVCVWSVGLP